MSEQCHVEKQPGHIGRHTLDVLCLMLRSIFLLQCYNCFLIIDIVVCMMRLQYFIIDYARFISTKHRVARSVIKMRLHIILNIKMIQQ